VKISELADVLGYELIQDSFDDRDITDGYTSDLLSDVMANAPDGAALITIQAHKNSVAVASMTNLAALVICNSRPLPEEMILAAQKERIAVLTTDKNQFQVSGEIYTALKSSD
jgi:hypothetical protein